MNMTQIIGALLIVGGVLGLSVGGFSFTKETHTAKLGPLQFSVAEKETVNIPMWASIASIVAGAGLLLVGGKKG